ncbi:helix-turn-helix domain-containing protein [Actinoplanes xinjiangensis]|uniref:helix-turn-helix domain-containing protein n=1 Tax=Actinoplanes xinjiangensis TaxID=512350 RepID=UPI00341F9E93
MNPDIDGAPDDEPVGTALARMRRRRGMTGAELAALVGMSQPKISRIERGHGQPDPNDIGALARALGFEDAQVRELSDRAARAQNRMTDWRPATSGPAGYQFTLADWETTATVTRVFEPALVPGPLQTSGYARITFQDFRYLSPSASDDQFEQNLLASVSGRIKRQEVLADSGKSFHFLIGEAAFRRRTCPPVEMLAQIGHIRDLLARRPNVRVGVVRDGAPVLPLLHGFTLLDDRLVVVELYNTGLISRSRSDVATYLQVFDTISEHAVDAGPVLDEYQAHYIDALSNPHT